MLYSPYSTKPVTALVCIPCTYFFAAAATAARLCPWKIPISVSMVVSILYT